ncbi:MAG: hypothetical protein M3R59_02025 [Verrucomicrobiota bacterium]|nr:hypothetical protein [Verrucomicrobiota bacterium]
MAGFDREPERAWDEYEWERFLQQQDQKTEKYIQLLETYLDDPNRDEIIAREMGWTQLLEGRDWTQDIDAPQEDDDDEEPRAQNPDSFEEHSLYRAAFALTVWIDQLFDEDSALQNEPSAVKLATHAALACAKLAAALSGEDADEIGMTIAYLKRSLKAITLAMDGAGALLREKRILPHQHAVLIQRLFQVRDGIITLVGEYRGEWRRRFGSEDFRG